MKKNSQNREWEAFTNLRDGFSRIVFADNGETILVKNDGVTGYEFVCEYLEAMREHYKGHLLACEMKLKLRLGRNFNAIRAIPNRYNAEVALISLNCCFGWQDVIPDHRADGSFAPEFTLCPERYNCPFNGFKESAKGKPAAGCNPVYECGLTRVQAEVADLMVTTSLSYEQMAEELSCSYSNIDNIRRRIFEKFGIGTRQELVTLLHGKRLY